MGEAIFEVYGVEPDEQRMKFYCLLDEFSDTERTVDTLYTSV